MIALNDLLRRVPWAPALTLVFGLSACVTSGRGEAVVLAQSGLATTAQLSSDVRDLGSRLQHGDAQNAFSRTWDLCQTRPANCAPKIPSEEVRAARDGLSRTIASRARAVDALHDAYGAMKTEADYDARADLSSAADEALKSAKAYAAIAGAPPIVSDVAARTLGFGAGLWADRQQAKRLRVANLKLAGAIDALRAGLAKEQDAYASLAQDIVDQEIEAQKYLLEAGLISSSDSLKPLADSVGATVVKDPDAVLGKSASARAAVEALIHVSAREKVSVVQARYVASLATLDELKRLHLAAAADKPLNPANFDRLLSEADALLARTTSK